MNAGYKMVPPYSSGYQHSPRSNRSNTIPTPSLPPRQRSRQRWPPLPMVEDEVVSLLREHTPPVPDLIGGEAQERGEIDQQPLILDTHPQLSSAALQRTQTEKNGEGRSLRSKSSTDSLGPSTPPESPCSDNPDRRYVWKPEPDVEIPVTYDDAKPIKHKPKPDHRAISPSPRQGKEPPTIDTKAAGESKPSSLPSPASRGPSPYAYSTGAHQNTFSGDHLLSPDSLYPEVRLSLNARNGGSRQSENSRGIDSRDGRNRASSDTGMSAQRPTIGRYNTAAIYPGEQLPVSRPSSFSRRVDLSSDESEHSHDEFARQRNSKRNSRQSFGSGESQHTSGARYEEPVQQSRSIPRYASKLGTSPLRPSSGTWDNRPILDAGTYGSSMPAPSSLPVKPMMKKAGYSPRRSPLSSPRTTPPPSPRPDDKRHSVEGHSSGRRSHPDSRPASPRSATTVVKSAGLALPDERYFRDNQQFNTPRSRQTSPLPSPEPESPAGRSDRFDVYTPSSASLTVPSTNTTEIPLRPRSREASAPFILSQPPRSQNLVTPLTKKTHSAINPRETPIIGADLSSQSPAESVFSPPLKSAMKKSVSPRVPVSLPPCPRSHYVAGYDDWSSIPSCPNFDICPTCRKAIENAGWDGKFYPSPLRPQIMEIRCDMSVPWVRMAWLLVLKKQAPRPDVVYQIMETIANEPPCPGRTGGVRSWYRLYNPETNRHISNFNVCSYCVRSIETIFPNLHGVFQPTKTSNPSQVRACDLSAESHRFATYVDTLEQISQQAATYRRPPNMLRFVHLAQQMAAVRECTRDDLVLGQPWHFMPHLSEFTVCEECYNYVVWPEITAGSQLAGSFNRTLQVLPPSPMGTSCQLYSPRMREVFRSCCQENDWVGLRAGVLQRVRVERDLQGRLAQVRMYGGEGAAEEVRRLVADWKRWE